MSPKLTIKDFYKGTSEPVNKKLSEIFLQLHISEKTGRGVPTILSNYGEKAFEFSENRIQVTIPFNRINIVDYHPQIKVGNKSGEKVVNKINKSQLKMIELIRNDPNVTTNILMRKLGLGHTAIQNNLTKLQKLGVITRIGSKKSGYWQVNDDN